MRKRDDLSRSGLRRARRHAPAADGPAAAHTQRLVAGPGLAASFGTSCRAAKPLGARVLPRRGHEQDATAFSQSRGRPQPATPTRKARRSTRRRHLAQPRTATDTWGHGGLLVKESGSLGQKCVCKVHRYVFMHPTFRYSPLGVASHLSQGWGGSLETFSKLCAHRAHETAAYLRLNFRALAHRVVNCVADLLCCYARGGFVAFLRQSSQRSQNRRFQRT